LFLVRQTLPPLNYFFPSLPLRPFDGTSVLEGTLLNVRVSLMVPPSGGFPYPSLVKSLTLTLLFFCFASLLFAKSQATTLFRCVQTLGRDFWTIVQWQWGRGWHLPVVAEKNLRHSLLYLHARMPALLRPLPPPFPSFSQLVCPSMGRPKNPTVVVGVYSVLQPRASTRPVRSLVRFLASDDFLFHVLPFDSSRCF